MTHHQEPDGLETEVTSESEVLDRHVGLGAVRGDATDLAAIVLRGSDVVLGAEARQHEKRDPRALGGLGCRPDQFLLGGPGETVVERRPAEAVTVRHLDHRNTGVVEGADDRTHLVDGELVSLVMAAVPQRRIGNPDVEFVGVLARVRHQIRCHRTCSHRARSCRGHADTPCFCTSILCRAISSPTLVAAAVMMSRLPAYGGRKSPAPSTSTKIETRA